MDHVVEEYAAFDAVPMETESTEVARRHGFMFSGQTGEYFRIWIVNLALTIVTLGIYSAWATVRSQRYFHAHTKVAGASFEYRGEPWAILRGRLLVVALMLGLNLLPQVSLVAYGLFLAAVIVALPFLVVSALRFRARNTLWRGVALDFHGTKAEAAKIFLLWPLFGLITFGLGMPYVFYKQRAWLTDHFSLGKLAFSHYFTAGNFYAWAIQCLGIGLLGFAFSFLLAGIPMLMVVGILFTYVVLFAYSATQSANIVIGGTALGPHRFESAMTTTDVVQLYVVNALALVCTVGLAYPWVRIRNATYKASMITLVAERGLDTIRNEPVTANTAAGDEVSSFLDLDLDLGL